MFARWEQIMSWTRSRTRWSTVYKPSDGETHGHYNASDVEKGGLGTFWKFQFFKLSTQRMRIFDGRNGRTDSMPSSKVVRRDVRYHSRLAAAERHAIVGCCRQRLSLKTRSLHPPRRSWWSTVMRCDEELIAWTTIVLYYRRRGVLAWFSLHGAVLHHRRTGCDWILVEGARQGSEAVFSITLDGLSVQAMLTWEGPYWDIFCWEVLA